MMTTMTTTMMMLERIQMPIRKLIMARGAATFLSNFFRTHVAVCSQGMKCISRESDVAQFFWNDPFEEGIVTQIQHCEIWGFAKVF
mmetsp:Transcript_1265/g.1814  ORF Transcript_1265/g.1814 Transcript_1265/m.1814 type:complete len:86 (-) Transcript_1265:1722-1979(-)